MVKSEIRSTRKIVISAALLTTLSDPTGSSRTSERLYNRKRQRSVDIMRRRDDDVSFLRTAHVILAMNGSVGFHPYGFAFVLTAYEPLDHTIVVRVWFISLH